MTAKLLKTPGACNMLVVQRKRQKTYPSKRQHGNQSTSENALMKIKESYNWC